MSPLILCLFPLGPLETARFEVWPQTFDILALTRCLGRSDCLDADAGTDRAGRLGTVLELDGSETRTCARPDRLVFRWVQLDGPARATILAPSEPVTGFATEARGVYRFRLIVRGPDDEDQDEVTLTVD